MMVVKVEVVGPIIYGMALKRNSSRMLKIGVIGPVRRRFALELSKRISRTSLTIGVVGSICCIIVFKHGEKALRRWEAHCL